MATTALESTPPERNAPERHLGVHPQTDRFAQAPDQFALASAPLIGLSSAVNRTSQYSLRRGDRNCRAGRVNSVCAGGSFERRRKMQSAAPAT